MTIVLLTLLAIAITLVLAGLFLSPKPQQAPPQPDIPFVTRNGTRMYRGDSQPYQPGKSVRLQRSVTMDVDYQTYKPYKPQRSYTQYETTQQPGNWSRVLSLINVKQLIYPRAGEPTPWLGVCLILIALFGIGMFSVQSLLLSHSGQSFWITNMTVATPAAMSQAAAKKTTSDQTAKNQPLFTGMAGASKALVRIDQMATNQYNSAAEYDKWALSACSTATMTEVMNAYGHNYRITDVLKVQSNLGQITPALGLVESSGIDITVTKFGFQTTYLNNPSLDQVIQIANQGRPVIVSFPPDRVPGGHILVVIGGQGSQVYLSDSSTLDQTVMSQAAFTSLWEGFAVVVTPKSK